MTDSEKLNKLAEWFDLKNPGEGYEVQQDLRRIAIELSALRQQLQEKDEHNKTLKELVDSYTRTLDNIKLQHVQARNEWMDEAAIVGKKVADLTAELHKAKEENEELKALLDDKDRLISEYKELLNPILDWGQNEGRQHGLRLGESITITVLNRAKEYTVLRKRCEDLEANTKAKCFMFASWLSNTPAQGRPLAKLWDDYQKEISQLLSDEREG